MRRLAWLPIVLGAHLASAETRHVLVMRSDGNADAATRSKIDTQVYKLAKNVEGNVEAGDVTFADAAAAVGCSANEPGCKDEVLATMGVDEIVVTNVDKVPGGEVKVVVQRHAKGTPDKTATARLGASEVPDAKLNADVGPMFGVAATKPPAATPEPAPTSPTPPPAPSAPDQPPPGGAAPPTTVTAAPNNEVTPPPEGQTGNSHSLEVAGMVTGGGLVVVGVVLWLEANDTQNQINMAPTRSPKDFRNLQTLESNGDAYAMWGNVAFIGGIALAAVSGFMYWHDKRNEHAQHARITPTVFPHGAGVALTFGGGR